MAMSMPPSPQLLALGLALALLVAGGGYLAGALSRSGALGALGVGTAVFGLGGPLWGLLLLAFFASSSALSEWRAEDKQDPAGRFQKGGRRDLGQVLANGGVAAVLAALQAASNLGWIGPLDLFPALVGALAAVTADTWATELGMLAAMPPRLITTGEPVPRGRSGGVTIIGTTAAVAGGAFIGAVAALLFGVSDLLAFSTLDPALLRLDGLRFALLAPLAGLAASAVDSYLGATVQALYADAAGEPTELPLGQAGRPRRLLRGWRRMDGDAVNFLASLVGALLALGLDRALFGW